LSNIRKMQQLIKEAEHWQSEIVSMENQQEAQIRASRGHSDQHMVYQVGKALDGNPWYNRAIGKRDRAVARATMYGIAAMALRETP
jgi:hypothetical protein